MPRIHKQAEQYPDRVAPEQGEEEPYLRMKDVFPDDRVTMDMGSMDPEKAKKFEDAFVRKMLNEVGDPSLPKVSPRATPAPTPPTPAAKPTVPRPADYLDLEPSTPEDWEQLARVWWGPQNAHMMDTPRKLKKRVQETQRTFTPWGKENYHPYDAAPDEWQQYADYKRRQAQ